MMGGTYETVSRRIINYNQFILSNTCARCAFCLDGFALTGRTGPDQNRNFLCSWRSLDENNFKQSYDICDASGLEITFWDEFRMILNGFASRNPKNILTKNTKCYSHRISIFLMKNTQNKS